MCLKLLAYIFSCVMYLTGSYLDFSHLTELENKFITEIYMKKQY